MGVNPKPLRLRSKYIKNPGFGAWEVFDEVKELSGCHCFSWFSVMSSVRNREVNSLDKQIEIDDFPVEPLSKMGKKNIVGKLSSGGEF